LVVTKYGSPTFDNSAFIDFGDGFSQTTYLNQVNYSKFVFENYYQSAGIYSVQFSIPNLNLSLSLANLTITGINYFNLKTSFQN